MKLQFDHTFNKSKMEPFRINCAHCSGLCCVALYFSKLDGFPKNKEAGTPCHHLQETYQCNIHATLKQRGLKGCMSYDCFGAGQYITQRLYTKPDWKSIMRNNAEQIFQSYSTILHIQQTLWYLNECSRLCLSGAEHQSIHALCQEGTLLKEQSIETLATLNLQPFTHKANTFLKNVCHMYATQKSTNKSKNYLGKDLSKQQLQGYDFSMSLLIGANLEDAELYGAMFLGTDMRDTNICNTDLRHCLFLTQIQMNAAKGNDKTLLPAHISRPTTW